MILITAICVAVVFGVSIYMMLGRDLKGVAMGVFLLSHAANLCILSMSGTPVQQDPERGLVFKQPPLLIDAGHGDTHGDAHGGEHADQHADDDPAAGGATPVASRRDTTHEPAAAKLDEMVDPLPQALILTAIVISFAVMGFLLALIVVTGRATSTLNVDNLAREQLPTPSASH